jgi:hypothetical protein
MGQQVKRRLTDLWVVGREVVLDDGRGDPITVWMQKNSATEAVEINRRCDAARARVLTAREDEDSDEWKAIEASVKEYSNGKKEPVVEFLLTEDRERLRRTHEARIADEDEWTQDNYLQGLRDAWVGGMEKRWLREPDDPEALRVKEALDRYVTQVNEAIDEEVELMRQSMMTNSLNELQTRMMMKLLDMDANQAWVREMWCSQIYYAVRDPENKRERYFESRDEVDLLSAQCFEHLHDAYNNLEVDVMEGKGSPAPTTSSPSSEERDGEETAKGSGLVGASR